MEKIKSFEKTDLELFCAKALDNKVERYESGEEYQPENEYIIKSDVILELSSKEFILISSKFILQISFSD
ncbi:MAG: hypothetical protein U9N10_11520 [Bacillota bacterium]|nr:hypothetical protein [Bacillota bacterium]